MNEGRKFKIARTVAGLRQHEIARRVGLSQAMISLIENNIIEPTPDQARRINEVLNENIFEYEVNRKNRKHHRRMKMKRGRE